MGEWIERKGHGKSIGHIPVTAALLIIVSSIAGCARPGAEPGDDMPEPNVATTSVTRQDLTTRVEIAGRLGHGDALPLTAGRDGILTWMPEEGTVIRRGSVVAEIDGVATRLLIGDRPAWRRLAVGEPDGPDIRQLNDNLAAFGYAERDALPDERFDWRTREAVYRWQDDLGLRRTGAVELGDVMFLPFQARIGTVETQPGMWVGAGQALAHATGTEQVVTVDLDPASRGSMSEGSPVVIVLPDRTKIDGIVRSVGRAVSTPEPDGEPTLEVEVEPVEVATDGEGSDSDAPARSGNFDVAPVVVLFERVLAKNVLVVPVGALLAVTEGGYSVERVTTAGVEPVAVEPGRFADGLVEVTGDIVEGDEVVVPS